MAEHGARRTRLSKRLSYVLRHDPGSIGVALDAAGWGEVDDVLAGLRTAGVELDRDELERLVADGTKRRFELDHDGSRIRARYGHSIPVEPAHATPAPPAVLYHGTATGTVATIRREGLRPMGRVQVHLSTEPELARQVGGRHGRPVVLAVDAAGMHRDGYALRQAAPGVWLVDEVPARYLRAP